VVELIAASVVIATRNRAAVLRRSLESLGCQSVQPAQLILVDGSDDTATRELCCEQPIDGLASAITWLRAATIGAARQRNQGIPECQHSVVGFFDDDILFEPACLARLWKGLQSDPQLGGVNAFIVNQHYQPPGLLSRAMFRAMSGQAAASYAGRVLGPAVNLLPEDRADLPELVATEWLNTTCTLYRHAALPDPPFPSHFSGYSMMEDLALSLKVGRRWKLANARAARIYHDSQPGPHKNDVVSLSKMEIVNRHYVMTNVLRRRRLVDYAKLSLWEGFQLATCAIQKRCGIEFWRMLGGKILGLRDIIRSNMSHKAWHEVNASSDIGSYHIDGVDNSNPRVAVIIPTFNGNARI
jgi:glycosyltransferase involved in cell wall biosynthesis